MIEQIKNIGHEVRIIDGEKDLVELWTKNTKPMDNVIFVNVDEGEKKVTKELRRFYKNVYKDALIYQQGNGHVGAGIKIEKYKNKDAIKIKEKKLASSLEFMEIDKSYLDEVWINIIEEVQKDINQSYFIVITKNNKKPRELFTQKYEQKIKETYLISDTKLNKSLKQSNCHLCGQNKKTYDTAIYKCFTNDKEVYKNTDKYNFSICEDCLLDVLNGRNYINDILKIRWVGSEVMFLPHEFNIYIKNIYEDIDNNKHITSLLGQLREAEEEVLDEISKTNCMTDIIFFSDPKSSSEWKITYAIRDVMPSRMSIISRNISKYKNKKIDAYFCLAKIMNYLCYSDGKFDSKNKDRMRLLDIIFHGSKYSRELFFNKVMSKYKTKYFESLNNKKATNRKYIIKDIHEIYNFMCNCGCLENSWMMINEEGEIMKYNNISEFFETNKNFFDDDIKKAWFIMGQIYRDTINASKSYYKDKSGDNIESDNKGQSYESSHLEKNFFFSRKFDNKTFILFANTCSEKLQKYGTYYSNIKDKMNQAKEYMASSFKKINNDEAKYIFFWGLDTLFEDDKKRIEEAKSKKEYVK
ncbi:TIGR02556 family CRISPR-associated protein [Intestinibacter bartlettii]|uniref:TIGR02556 family CRISPR-associated protein n=1 Tax=Intestinibacter bartlettii TaxID=261299 RepID=UPI001D1265AE|nr:TIGR02556 family CRISPR-associated protein [Intestinibacter bartlettii]MCC2705790.1 TIGR02556 family CRISPR-associated protein [Intestinibacter bartlettii]MCC2761240.1 TIGR02556 family CRISPR-associated protein [Intestinibacter bartlettii]